MTKISFVQGIPEFSRTVQPEMSSKQKKPEPEPSPWPDDNMNDAIRSRETLERSHLDLPPLRQVLHSAAFNFDMRAICTLN